MRRQEDISSKTTAPEDRAGTVRPAGAGPLMNAAIAVPVKSRWVPCSLGHSTYLNVISFSMKAGIANEKDNETIEVREPADALAESGKVFWKKSEELHKYIDNIIQRQHRGSPRQESVKEQNSFGFGFSNPVHRISTVHVIRSRDLNCIYVLIINETVPGEKAPGSSDIFHAKPLQEHDSLGRRQASMRNGFLINGLLTTRKPTIGGDRCTY